MPTSASARSIQPARGEPARVEIEVAEDKLKLVGSYYAQKDDKKLSPAVLLVHDAGGKRGDLDEIAQRLQQKGFAVLTIDLRGHGESVGHNVCQGKTWAELDNDAKQKTWSSAMHDIKAAMQWLAAQPGIHKSNIALLGDRAGCTLAARQASKDENVRSLVLLDPPSALWGFDLSHEVQALAGVPTLIAVTKEAKHQAETIAESGRSANNGLQFIEIAVFKGVSLAPVLDKRLPADITNFMWSKACPKKGD